MDKPFCVWRVHDEVHMPDTYETTCKNAFLFADGGPDDNGFKYCPYCGRELLIEVLP